MYRYDHHCPWINGCVGAHNIGKFTLFLFILAVGLAEVLFCNVCLLFDLKQWVHYRKQFEHSMPDSLHIAINVVTIVFSLVILLALIGLLLQQLQNIFTNSTSYERTKKVQQGSVKKS